MISVLQDAWQRVVYLFRGSSEADELREEMAYHLEMEVAAFERAGMSHEDAVRAAHAKFGSADGFAEETREASGAGFLLDFWQDIRHALRGLRRTPGFAAISILTLAVGIGVATVVFSIADHLVYRPIPGVHAQRELTSIHVGAEDIWNFASMSPANLADMAAATPALSSMAAYQPSMSLQAALGDGPAEALQGQSRGV